jgi:hypothetical protein
MTFTNFIPRVWNAVLLEEFRQAAVFAALTNREYEGDAQKGNSVRINTAVPVEVKNYKKTVGGKQVRETTPDDVTTTFLDLNIDQEKVFDFLVDDIDRRQAAGNVSAFARSAALGLQEDADKWIAAQMIAGAATGNKLTGALTDNGKDVWSKIRDMRLKLNKAKVPVSERYLVVNADFEALLLGHDSKLTAVELAKETPSGLRDGYLGRVLGFQVFTSENLPGSDTNKAQAVAFHKSAFGYVSQISQTEPMRAEKQFSDRLRGLHVYGGVTIRESGIATFTAN